MSAGLSGMKKDLHPTTGPIPMVPLGQKSENFCGATQIDDDSSARRCAITHLSLVTGVKPVGAYLGFLFSPPSAVHSTRSSLPHSHHRRLSGRNSACLLACFIGFVHLNLAQVYNKFDRLSIPRGEEKSAGQKARRRISADIRTRNRTWRRCRRPECPSPPAAGRDRTPAGTCRSTYGSRSRKS